MPRPLTRRLTVPLGAATAVLLATTVLAPPSGARAARAAAAPCDPFGPPAYAGDVPTPESVIGFPLGEQEVTVAQSDAYLLAVAEASDRVSAGVMATSQQGRPLRYAVVGEPADVRRARAAAAALRDPDTTRAQARAVAEQAPAIAWVTANVHGNEESGTDASLQVLRDLADRTDCAADAINDNTVVVVVPTQNPDGREADTRRNAYSFDMNRDWFARTQPETDGKVELLRRLPAVLFIDDHEMGAEDYFFPPNADPVYHEIADLSISWINDLYGAAMADAFERQDIPFFNYDIYDLLYMGYGDTVPTTGFLGAGMTFEKNNADPIADRTHEQYVALWASLSALAGDKVDVLTGWARSHRQARRQGQDGTLEPNAVFAPGNEVEEQVPDITVRHYFIEPPARGKGREVRALVRRLQRMDVEVRRLTEPLRVPDYTPYGRPAESRTLPAGTFWVPMAQAQKHWVQAMLNETTYVPFPYFYDVTAWSGPLLFNVAGGRSGKVLRPSSRLVRPVREPGPPRPRRTPRVGLLVTDDTTSALESTGWMRWLFEEKWQLPYVPMGVDAMSARRLDQVDVLVVPNVDADSVEEAVGTGGARLVRRWVADGGRLVTAAGGTEVAARLGLTSAQLSAPTSDIPGSLIRARTTGGPLTRGVGSTVWSFYAYDNVMRMPDPATVAVRYPEAGSPDFFVSGFERGAEELAGTAAVGAERYGDGQVVAFAADPNFRAFTDGTQKILWNAIVRRDPAARGQAAAAERAAATRSALAVDDLDGRLVVTVRPGAASAAAQALRANGLRPTRATLPGAVRLTARVRTAEESPVTPDLAADLSRLGADLLAARVP